ncbi:rhophilin-2 [Caerostris extrusa]|uniref:Rhophilin-2 n=1 Tax=Caerostris extrusa TaxID=172846 RepID=A0AAV4PVF1_CAEEX|nr:rhophilin-2 [Caerostris extrusa]
MTKKKKKTPHYKFRFWGGKSVQCQNRTINSIRECTKSFEFSSCFLLVWPVENFPTTSAYRKPGYRSPLAATCRGRLQVQRAKLNQEINYQTMMRNGAEKLYRATTNKKLKETIALELSFVNSSLQLLKEQLADLNSSVQLYQNNSSISTMPMVPLGLKETKEIDFKEPFKDFILEHYSEDDSRFDSAIQQLNQIRQAIRTPCRDLSGVKMLFHYYNLLYFIDKRFFASHRNLGLHFEWFDSLTGLPSMQKSIAFEKASVYLT